MATSTVDTDVSRPASVTRVVIDPTAPARRPFPPSVRRVRRRSRVATCSGSAAPSLMGSRLTRRGRVVVAAVWLALLGAAVGVVAWTDSTPESRPDPDVTTTVEVRAGDTLWDIAGQLTPGADLRETVALIAELNDLGPTSALRPGQTLVVPSHDRSD